MYNSYLSELGLSKKEEKILLSAIDIISTKGYSAATTSEIAKSAGVAEGTIFRYFKTKKDILKAIVIHTIKVFSSKIILSGVEKIFSSTNDKDIKTVVKELLLDRYALVNNFFPMVRIIFTEVLFHEDVREVIYENLISNAKILFSDFCNTMKNKGYIRKEIESDVLFRTLMGNLAILVFQQKLFGDKIPIDDFEKEIDKTVDIILNGIV